MDNSQAEYWNTIAAQEGLRPFMLLAGHCKISIDGNQWCVLYGENLQDGVAGFGDSPEAASRNFDANWHAKLQASSTQPVCESCGCDAPKGHPGYCHYCGGELRTKQAAPDVYAQAVAAMEASDANV